MAKNTDMSSWFFNENFNGVPDDFFDVDGQSLANDVSLDLFDISSVPVEENGEVEDWEAKFESIELPPPDALASLSSAFCGQGYSQANKKSQVSLNRVPKVLDSRRSLHQCNSSSSKGSCVIQTSSPTSVLDSNSSTSNSHLVPFNPKTFVPMKRRSKHPRIPSSKQWSNSDLFQRTSKRKEKRKTQSSVSSDANRKCTHCQATETPQWREGPQGPKTLCNACGVRYRSGRLFPEYRPASSPTFVPSLHSNSHRKVAELRKKASLETPLVVPQIESKTCGVATS